MAGFDGFHVGDEVAHITVGDGIVRAVENGEVVVEFARRDKKGRHSIGRYDRRWFELHSTYLFHRSSKREG